MKLVSNCEQVLNIRISRRLITMEKVQPYRVSTLMLIPGNHRTTRYRSFLPSYLRDHFTILRGFFQMYLGVCTSSSALSSQVPKNTFLNKVKWRLNFFFSRNPFNRRHTLSEAHSWFCLTVLLWNHYCSGRINVPGFCGSPLPTNLHPHEHIKK